MAKLTINLFGAAGQRSIEIQPKGGFPTRHIKIGSPDSTPLPEITPDLPKAQPKPAIPAFNKAWEENRQRIIDFLGEGFDGNLSEGCIMPQLGEAIANQYAPRKAMTDDQWRALTAVLQQSDWDAGHWLRDLKQRIWCKYEDRRIKRLLTYHDFAPTGEPIEDEIPVKVYIEIDNPQSTDYPKRLIYEGVKTKGFDTYCQAYADANHMTIRAETRNGKDVKWFICESECQEIGRQNARNWRARRANR